MTIKFYDWRHDDGYLYLTKVGFNASGLFAELASVPSELKTRNENQIRSYICENVNTLLHKGWREIH